VEYDTLVLKNGERHEPWLITAINLITSHLTLHDNTYRAENRSVENSAFINRLRWFQLVTNQSG